MIKKTRKTEYIDIIVTLLSKKEASDEDILRASIYMRELVKTIQHKEKL